MNCDQCGGSLVLLGSLGSTEHYRCRQCGWTASFTYTDHDDSGPYTGSAGDY